MQIRPCRVDDLPRVQALDALSFGTHHLFPDFVLRQYLDLAGPCFILAERDGELLGYVLGAPSAASDEPTGWLLSAATTTQARGQGVARILGQAVLNEFGRRGIRRVLATVSPDNLASQRAQQALGFRIIAREADYLGPGEDRLVMEWRDDEWSRTE
jgi:ribosomal protein S18 acetylase RimI-like enzyme